MSNRIEQYDLISKEAVEVVKETTNALIKTLDSMKDLVASGVDLNKAFSGGAKGLGDTVKATKQVTDNTNLFVQTSRELEAQQAKLVAAQAKQIAAQSKAAQETRKANALTSEQIKIAKLQAIVNDENAGKLEKLRAANALLRIQKEKLKETDANYVTVMAELNAQMDANQEAIDETNNSEQKRVKGIGQYKEQMSGLIGDLKAGQISAADFGKGMVDAGKKMAVAFVTNPILMTIAALTGLFLAGKKVVAMVDETVAQRRKVSQLTGEVGQDLSDLTAKTEATAKTFGVAFDELAVSQNNFAKQMGITNEAANELINKGFIDGADASGEFLAMLSEYGPQLKEAGYSAEEAVNMMSMQVKSGVFTDKGIDVIKEATLRLREMPKSTQDALEGIGISSQDMMQRISSGQITVKDAMEEVSRKMAEFPAQSSEVGTAMADIFGGPGEDAGLQYLLMLGQIQDETGNLTEKSRDQMTAQELMLEANQKLSKSWSDLMGNGTTGFDKIRASAKLLVADGLESLVNGIQYLKDGFIELYNNSLPVRAVLEATFANVKTAITLVLVPVKEFWNILKGGVEILGAILTGRIRDLPSIAKGIFSKAKDIAKDAAKSAGENYKKAWDNTLNGKIEIPIEDASKDAIKAEAETLKQASKMQSEAAKKAADERQKRAEKAAEELKKIEDARAEAELNAANRVFESRKMLAEQYVNDEFEKARQINAIEQEQINYSLFLLEQKFSKEKAGSAEAIKLADEIAAKKFDLEKKAMEETTINENEKKKLWEEADAMLEDQYDAEAALDKKRKDDLDKKLKELEDYYAEQAYLARENIGLFSTNAKEREKQEKELAVKLLDLQRAQLSETLRLGDLTVEAERNAKQQLLDIDQQLADQKMANLEAEAEKRKQVTQMSLDMVSQGFDTIGGIYDMQAAKLERQHELDLALTEEGTEERILAEAKYDKEKRKLDRKQAVLDRAQGLFNIGVSTATAIMNALAQFGPIAGAVFAGIIGAMGAAQIATVLATPLPAYKDGGVVPFDQIARVSEEGQELMISPSGSVGLTPINESIMSLEKGTRIVPHNDTMKLLASQAYANIAIESNRSNKILEQIRDKSPDLIVDGSIYVNKKGLKGRYRL